MATTTEPLMSTKDLADYLGVPMASVYQWRHKRTGPPGFRVGKHVRYRREDVDRWLTEHADDREPAA